MVSRPAASDLSLNFVINFQKNFLSELYQIQIMWLFLPKLSLHEKNLAFKGQEGQERSCNFLFQDFWELRLMQIRFLWKMNHFLFIQKLNLVEFKGVYFTVAWPSWPLKAKIFSSKDFFSKKLYMVEIMLFFVYWLLRYRRGPKSKRDRVHGGFYGQGWIFVKGKWLYIIKQKSKSLYVKIMWEGQKYRPCGIWRFFMALVMWEKLKNLQFSPLEQ